MRGFIREAIGVGEIVLLYLEFCSVDAAGEYSCWSGFCLKHLVIGIAARSKGTQHSLGLIH